MRLMLFIGNRSILINFNSRLLKIFNDPKTVIWTIFRLPFWKSISSRLVILFCWIFINVLTKLNNQCLLTKDYHICAFKQGMDYYLNEFMTLSVYSWNSSFWISNIPSLKSNTFKRRSPFKFVLTCNDIWMDFLGNHSMCFLN